MIKTRILQAYQAVFPSNEKTFLYYGRLLLKVSAWFSSLYSVNMSACVHADLHPHTWTHIHTQVIHIDLIIRSKKKIQFLVSRESNTGDNGTKMRETKHLLVPFLPLSFGCHQALWGSLLVSCWHILKGKQNPILPTGRKPLTCVFPLPVCFWGFFLFLSVGIFQASSLLSRNKWGLCVCVCVCVYTGKSNRRIRKRHNL